ncbi:uncharacterized protein At4g18257-like [Zingiber officinale]|uniref:Uncharacterized protein n=1 Tax=Zingiber officinale TaxID=94328 RepID=A0A8J5EUG3_ZINOF|nr:uncharacterized protein At4g18257-like [Zingiber officinale]XP_042445257.1 uncharacterized protein At4g18257-like [Zingiber officinale]KAG6472866.1 hypothetical protein ZIOFF_070344 [Zingiber officinale]
MDHMGGDRKGGVEEEKRKKRVESLGWLTESSVMPKKRKSIEGVGAASIVELKAQLYRSQEEARKAKEAAPAEFLRPKKKPLPSDVFSHKNAGVENRANKDKLEMKAMKDGSAVYAALEKKAELYEKLARGELPDEEDKERYCVDFFHKTLEQDNSQPPEEHSTPADLPQQKEDAHTDETVLFARPFGLGRAGSTVDGDEHKRFVREVHEEVSQARQKATMLKLRRQEQEASRREKLKQAYLKKRLEQLTSAKQMASSENCTQTVNSEASQK